jgi:mannose-6-phosphate isomerase-like protein (cupin superfamily)
VVQDEYRARYRTARQIRSEGAIGNLFDGVTITAHGLETRLLAWPGTGFQTEAVHVTTVAPGQSSDRYTYDLAEEAILCRYGEAEVWLRDRWVTLRPGDMAYLPEGVEHQVRNPAGNDEDAILVHQICPPQFDLYTEHGFYNAELGVVNYEAIEKAAVNAPRVEPPEPKEMEFRDDQPEVRAQNLAPEDVKAKGALFNVLEGAAFTGIGLPMRLVLWPGAGTRLVGFNYAYCGTGVQDAMHKHPVSDEFLVMWSGSGQLFVGDMGWVDADENDVAMAPCGVVHGHRSTADRGPSMMGGFASPPQMDLVIPTPYYRDGVYAHPQTSRLTEDEEHAADLPV